MLNDVEDGERFMSPKNRAGMVDAVVLSGAQEWEILEMSREISPIWIAHVRSGLPF